MKNQNTISTAILFALGFLALSPIAQATGDRRSLLSTRIAMAYSATAASTADSLGSSGAGGV
jgi:hypothetical protein